MTLKHRVKRIERAIIPRPKARLWIVRDSYNGDRADPDGKKRMAAKIEAIKDGKVKNQDGTFYQEGDIFFIISRIFTDERPDELGGFTPLKPLIEKPVLLPPEEESIEQRIEVLKKRKEELEQKIKEREK